MAEKTQKELLIGLVEVQNTLSNDIVEIKTCLLGDEYHPKGLVHQVEDNKKCIDDIKRNRIPSIEKSVERRSGIIGGVVAFITVAVTTVASYIIFKR